jgi:hypothetical protein
MKNTVHIGIIGNFKGHLNGAENVEEYDLPNGIFVINNDVEDTITEGREIKYPAQGCKLDIEPEFVIRYQIQYVDGSISGLTPLALTIGNDFTIRDLSGSNKISERKSWGSRSKGINSLWWDVPAKINLTDMDHIKLVSYIERDGLFYRTTPIVDSSDTKVFGLSLVDWIIDRVKHQSNVALYEEIFPVLARENFPEELVLYTGAPNYTEWGEANFLQLGDIVHVAAYDSVHLDIGKVSEKLFSHQHINNENMLSFMQEII